VSTWKFQEDTNADIEVSGWYQGWYGKCHVIIYNY
jgi:hypothetical protein